MEYKTISDNDVKEFISLDTEGQIKFIENKIKLYNDKANDFFHNTLKEHDGVLLPNNIEFTIKEHLKEGFNTLAKELSDLALAHAKKADSFKTIEILLIQVLNAFYDNVKKSKNNYNTIFDLINSTAFKDTVNNHYRTIFIAFYNPELYDDLVNYLLENLTSYSTENYTLPIISMFSTCLLFHKTIQDHKRAKQTMTSLDFQNFLRYLPSTKQASFKYYNAFLHYCYFNRDNFVDLISFIQKHVISPLNKLKEEIKSKELFEIYLSFERVLENIKFEDNLLNDKEHSALTGLLFNDDMKDFILDFLYCRHDLRLPFLLSRLNYLMPDYFFYETYHGESFYNPLVNWSPNLVLIAVNYYRHNNAHNFQLSLLAEKMLKDEQSFIQTFLKNHHHLSNLEKVYREDYSGLQDLISADHNKGFLNVFNAELLSRFYLPVIENINKRWLIPVDKMEEEAEHFMKSFFNTFVKKMETLKSKRSSFEVTEFIILVHVLVHLFLRRGELTHLRLEAQEKIKTALFFYKGLKITVEKIKHVSIDDDLSLLGEGLNPKHKERIIDFYNCLNESFLPLVIKKTMERLDGRLIMEKPYKKTPSEIKKENEEKLLKTVSAFIDSFKHLT